VSACSILVVDDDPSIRHTVAEILDLEGYPVETAGNGAEALRAVERTVPEMVLLDMRMPVLDGWGFARALGERGLKLTLVVMSAAQDARRWCEEIGGDECLPKPFDLDQLLRTVERMCAAAR
jgi:CheY-like chemotaxis protein